MQTRRLRRRSLKTWLPVLVSISIITLLLPTGLTGRLISLIQIIVPFQDAASSATDAVFGGPADSGEADQAMQIRTRGLEHQVAALALRNVELENEVEVLTATRLWDVAGGRIGVKGRLIPARVVGEDMLPWRSSRLITAGNLRGIRSGSPVATQVFAIDRGEDGGLRDGLAILLRETLVGFAEQVGTHTSRVRLLCDLRHGMKVRIGRLESEGFTALEPYFWLLGKGRGVMEVRDVDRRDVEAGNVNVGDLVLSDPMNETLPAALTIGRITKIRSDLDNPLLSILTVESEVDQRSLRRVYVYVPDESSKITGAAGTPEQ